MAAIDEAILESFVFLDHFADLPDPRQLSKVIYPLDEIVLLSLRAKGQEFQRHHHQPSQDRRR